MNRHQRRAMRDYEKDAYLKQLERDLAQARQVNHIQSEIIRVFHQGGKLAISIDSSLRDDEIRLGRFCNEEELNTIEQQAVLRTAQIASDYIKNQLIPYTNAVSNLLSLLNAIDNAIALCTDTRLLKEHLATLDETLSSMFTRLVGTARNANLDDDFSIIAPVVAGRIEGVQRLLAGKDNGEYLRQVVNESASDKVKQTLEARLHDIDFGGRASGMTPELAHLAALADNAYQRMDQNWSKAGRYMLTVLQKSPEDELTPFEHFALQKILQYCRQDTTTGKWMIDTGRSRNLSQYLSNLVARWKECHEKPLFDDTETT